jgi:hypothetical protein
MSWVALSGLPTDSNQYYGVVTPTTPLISAASVGDTGFAPIVRADTGDFMITPLYPLDPASGGEVQIVFTDGADYTSDPIMFSIDSLPEAPGEFAAIVALQQRVLDNNLRLAGLTRDSLLDVLPDDVPLSRVPLYLSFGGIDDPRNPNSLRALADQTASILDSSAFDMDILDRILAETGIRAYFEELVASLDTTPISFISGVESGLADIPVNSRGACLTAPNYGITNCGALASAMERQYGLATAASSASQRVVNDGIKAGLMIASFFPGVAIEAAAIGTLVWGDATMKEGLQNLLPSEFDDGATSFNPSETDFNEDFTTDGNWTQFAVTATSRGWTLDKVAIEVVLRTSLKARRRARLSIGMRIRLV